MFYRLSKPDFYSEREDKKQNPVTMYRYFSLPGVYCDACNNYWASSDKLRADEGTAEKARQCMAQIDKYLMKDERSWHIDDFYRAVHEVSNITGISETVLSPGLVMGLPIAEVSREITEDVVHPFSGVFWVNSRTKQAFETAGISGIHFVRVHAQWTRKPHLVTDSELELWEIVVTGHAWRPGSTIESLTDCTKCGRMDFPNPKRLVPDPARWDRTDVFHVDRNPNIVLVTQKVVDVLEQHKISNLKIARLVE